jgi:hypothetical protein
MRGNGFRVLLQVCIGSRGVIRSLHETLAAMLLSTTCAVLKRSYKFIYFLMCLVLLTSQPVSADYSKYSIGTEYTSGDFGGDTSISEWYMPVTAKYVTDQYIFRITVPYLRITAPAGATIFDGTVDQLLNAGSGESITQQGLGDIITSLTRMDVLNTESASGVSLDLTGKIKFATADEASGLGTGENDFTLQASLIKSGDYILPYAVVGYTFRGDPPGIDLADVWSVLVGGMFRVTPGLSASLDYYFREPSSLTSTNQQELTAMLNFKISREYGVQWYALRGFSDASPDWGMGLIFSVTH